MWSGTARATSKGMSGDTTKIIPPQRRGPRYVDLVLAAIAGSLATVLVIALLFLGNSRFGILPASSSPSPSASASASPSASLSIRIVTQTPTPTEAPSTPQATTAPPASTPPRTSPPGQRTTATPTPIPTKTP